MYKAAVLALSLTLTWLSLTAWAAEVVYRWRDADGKVQYAKALPPEAADLPYEVLSATGVVIEQVKDPKAERLRQQQEVTQGGKTLEPLYSDAEKQDISDRLLLAKYANESQIAEAMDLELANLKYDERLLESARSNVIDSMEQFIRACADRQRAGQEPDSSQVQELDKLRQALLENRVARKELESRAQRIRAAFDSDLERYRSLTAEGKPQG